MSVLQRVRVVMVQTWHPGNIGSAARAMKTMGLRDLWLVAPKSFPDERATALAAEATDVLDAARVVATLDQALNDCVMTIAASARPRSNDVPALNIDQTVDKLLGATASGQVALVFGPERAGLTSADVDLCQHRTMLPTAPDCRSLNVAQAVQIYAYALQRGAVDLAELSAEHLATSADRDELFAAWQHALLRLNFSESEVSKMLPRYQQLLHRAEPTERDIKLLRGMLARIDQRAVPSDRQTSSGDTDA